MQDPLDFLKFDWVKSGEPEILYVRRAVNPRDKWSGHMAFPGGKAEAEETDQEAAERETLEEIGLDLRGPGFACLGALDDREIKPPASGKPIMILCPFVYLQLTPSTPPLTLTPEEIASIHWIPLSFFFAAARDNRRWRLISFPIARHLLPARVLSGGISGSSAPRWRTWIHMGLEKSLTYLLGSYSYRGVLLPTTAGEIVTPLQTPVTPHVPHAHVPGKEEEAKAHAGQSTSSRLLLWGLTLWMTSDVIDLCHDPGEVPVVALSELGAPRYSQKDIDWVFGLLARQLGAGGNGGVQSGAGSGGTVGRVKRKPAVSVTERPKLEYYQAIRISVATAMTLRAVVTWVVVRHLRKVREWCLAVL
ncbi:hypothetical protein SpCBS45565_g04315 [Spizellomyces sp. 'palustris']|nr:hypothetical protein SpCBS45565_g04315 [Spizellomyces sp. 'palustris']